VRHVRQDDVVEEAGSPPQEPLVLPPFDALAYQPHG
jgi:hypothetical protein